MPLDARPPLLHRLTTTTLDNDTSREHPGVHRRLSSPSTARAPALSVAPPDSRPTSTDNTDWVTSPDSTDSFTYPAHHHRSPSASTPSGLRTRQNTMPSSATSPVKHQPNLAGGGGVARRTHGGTTSPVQSISTSPTATSSASNGGGGGGGGGGGYIGGGFAGASNKRRSSLGAAGAQTRRWWTTRGRATKLAILVGLAVCAYWIAGGWKSEVKPRQKLRHRWWEADELPAEDLAALLPRPALPARPPRPKPPSSLPSHTLSQLLKLPSTLSVSPTSAAADWTAVVHFTSSAQLQPGHLAPLLHSLARQAPLAPSRIILLAPQGLEAPPAVLGQFTTGSGATQVTPVAYPVAQPPVVALAAAAQTHVASDYVLYVDGNLPASKDADALPKDYVRTLLHASGTAPYSAALLSAGGLALSSLPSSSSPGSAGGASTTCVYPSSPPSSLSTTHALTVPTLPFLLSTAWLLPRSPSNPSTSILQGLDVTLPVEAALSAALWTKHAIPAYALPIPVSVASADAEGSPADGGACARLRRALDAQPAARELFAPHAGGGAGLRALQASGDARKGGLPSSSSSAAPLSAAEEADAARAALLQKGTVVLLLSGADELGAARRVACRFARSVGGRGETDLKVVVADLDVAEAEREGRRRAGGREEGECHLDLTPLGAGASASSSTAGGAATAEPISLALVDLLDALQPAPAFVVYLTDGPRAREYEEVLRWMGGVFGPRKGGERRSRVKAEREVLKGVEGEGRGRPTVVGMSREEVGRAEWMGALEVEALRHWHVPRIDLSLVTNDRPVSLHRLVTSLQTAHYYGDEVSLAINLEQTADRLTQRLVDDLRWPHGTFNLRHRILLGGLMPAIVESWYPTSNDTYGVLLEDDVEVSPLFYGWLKFTILQYRYTLAGRRASKHLFGVSLYNQKNIELRPEGRQPFDATVLFRDLSLHPTTPYLSQIPCSWGAAYFPEHWREFHAYLALRLSELALPISETLVPAIRSNKWPRSWKKYFIELVYLRGYTMLYPNYPAFESLSTNHLEKGQHVHTSKVDEKKKAQFEVPLLPSSASLIDTLPGGPSHERLPPWDSLPVMDLWGALASADELLERGWQTTRQASACPVPPDLTRPPSFDARELLCKKVWDRETEGRLVNAAPLPGPLARRPTPAQPAAQQQQPGEAANGAPVAAAAPVAGQDVRERAFFRADPAAPPPPPPPPARRDFDSADPADDEDEDEDARPARPQHDHLHEAAAVAADELDGADLSKRGALFDDEGGDEAHGRVKGRWRKAVDLEARRQHGEESEWGLDESESEAEAEAEAGEGADEVEGAASEGDEQPKKRQVRWARAD